MDGPRRQLETEHAEDRQEEKTQGILANPKEHDDAGNLAAMLALTLPDRSVFPPQGGPLIVGNTAQSNARRQGDFNAGRKIDYRIEKAHVQVYSTTAVSTFERLGTLREVDGTVRDVHLRITGVWVKQADGKWLLGHRHESPF